MEKVKKKTPTKTDYDSDIKKKNSRCWKSLNKREIYKLISLKEIEIKIEIISRSKFSLSVMASIKAETDHEAKGITAKHWLDSLAFFLFY